METPFYWAQNFASDAMRDLNRAATSIERHLTDDDIIPAHIEKLQALSAQLWEMEDIARQAEHALASINAEYRAGNLAHT